MQSTAQSATQANAAKAAVSASHATKTVEATKAAQTAAKTASVAGKTAAAAAKTGWGVATAGVGKSVLLKGTAVGIFAARGAAWPALVVGGAFGGAAWVGAYELASGTMAAVLPPSANPDPRAHAAGLAAVPCTIGASAWAGWRFCPPITPSPERLLDMAGWMRCLKSVPAKHCGAVAVTSATAATRVSRGAVSRRGLMNLCNSAAVGLWLPSMTKEGYVSSSFAARGGYVSTPLLIVAARRVEELSVPPTSTLIALTALTAARPYRLTPCAAGHAAHRERISAEALPR